MKANLKHGLIGLVALTLGACSGAPGGGGAASNDRDRGYDALKAGNIAQAQQFLEAAYAKDPNDPYTQLNLGATYDRLNQPDKARPLYTKVLDTGKNVVPGVTTNGTKGKSLADMAQENLAAMKK